MVSLSRKSEWLVEIYGEYGQGKLLSRSISDTENYLSNKVTDGRTWVMEGQLPTEQKLTATPGFDIRGSGQDYGYDASGNITQDPSRGLDILYDYQNLPHSFTTTDGNQTVEIIYSSMGQKLAERTTSSLNANSEITRTYLGDLEFEAGELVVARHARGRVSGASSCRREQHVTGTLTGDHIFEAERITSDATLQVGSSISFKFEETATLLPGFEAEKGSSLDVSSATCMGEMEYEYVLSDHLGNARVRFADVDGDGAVSADEVLSEHHYYAFGMEMEGEWNRGDDEQRYRYNGMERNEELGLDLAAVHTLAIPLAERPVLTTFRG